MYKNIKSIGGEYASIPKLNLLNEVVTMINLDPTSLFIGFLIGWGITKGLQSIGGLKHLFD